MRLRRKKSKPRVEMLPLMDVVFLLLVFFIYSMMSMAVHRGMPLSLPSSRTAEREAASPLAITVKADGTIFVDKIPATLETLPEILRQRQEAAQGGEGVTLQVFAEDVLAYQDLYRVLDAAKAAGIQKISLQATQEKSL